MPRTIQTILVNFVLLGTKVTRTQHARLVTKVTINLSRGNHIASRAFLASTRLQLRLKLVWSVSSMNTRVRLLPKTALHVEVDDHHQRAVLDALIA